MLSCDSHSEQWETIAGVESYIEEKPDSELLAYVENFTEIYDEVVHRVVGC